MQPRLDEKDAAILTLIQDNCRLTAKEISKIVKSPITTVFAKIKRMEEVGVIKEYRAVLNSKALNMGTTAFILASVSYRMKNDSVTIPQRDVAEKIASFPEVQEIHIISGDWDLLIKLRTEDVEAAGRFVIDKLRLVTGIEKTLTCMVFDTCKETTKIPIETRRNKQKPSGLGHI